MKNKKCLIIFLTAILISICAIFEYITPNSASANFYYVKINTAGSQVKKSHFKGYQYITTARKANGRTSKITFYSDTKLPENRPVKIVVGANKLLASYQKVMSMPKYYAKKQ
ncbi:YxeA family protein [Listeria sp. PSOL-1]|uniref:YxeA family protein n=1 Tax=Listeria sp. PSOL-1 TaxID=1844999 RepID=UPI0013D4A411|nr:YxeA family protein [Listeria sp. PSOL-1]